MASLRVTVAWRRTNVAPLLLAALALRAMADLACLAWDKPSPGRSSAAGVSHPLTTRPEWVGICFYMLTPAEHSA